MEIKLIHLSKDGPLLTVFKFFIWGGILYSYCMPVCSIVKTITPRCRGRPDALLHEAEGRVQ